LTSTTTAPATSETPRRPSRSSSGSTLGRYILIRALLIIPTVFILVTLVLPKGVIGLLQDVWPRRRRPTEAAALEPRHA
jgi:hypothetical protein